MNALASSYQQYKKHDVMMANPLELIIMLYNGCIKKLKMARIAIEKNSFEDANTHLQKAQDIVIELINGLDFGYSIAGELMSLYEFILFQLRQINVSKDAAAIEPVVEMLSALRDTWMQVQKQNKGIIYEVGESE